MPTSIMFPETGVQQLQRSSANTQDRTAENTADDRITQRMIKKKSQSIA